MGGFLFLKVTTAFAWTSELMDCKSMHWAGVDEGCELVVGLVHICVFFIFNINIHDHV